MSSSPPTEAPAAVAFICDCGVLARSACKGLAFYKKHGGRRYCVLHYPGKDKSAVFNQALKRKLDAQHFNFREVWFPNDADFTKLTFTTPANFHSAKFSAVVNFKSATFNAEAYFNLATFSAGVYFNSVKFSSVANFHSAAFVTEADFSSAAFNAEADFSFARFGAEAYFSAAAFNAVTDFSFVNFNAGAYFADASLKDHFIFAGRKGNQVFGDKSPLNLQFVIIEKPDRFSFHTVTLRPHWFVNVDARKFEFINADWNWRSISTKQEIKSIGGKDVLSKHRLLAVACRNLAVNAEENHRYEEASRFRYMAMEARRLERWRGFAFWTLGWWYWLASGYGERVWRAFVVLIGIWLVAAALYTGIGFARWEPRVASEKEAAEARRDEVG